MTGTDILSQLKEKPLGDELLLPEVILRHNTNILLDDITLDDISNQLQIPIKTVMNDGQHLLHAVLGSETMSKPIVAIVGRPNVGKSTLFNKLIGQRLSIVDDTPGVTRDRIYGECEWENRVISLVDTGGIEPMSQDVILSQMRTQAQIAIDGADVIIMVTDVRSGVVATDEEVAIMLKKSGRPVILAVNKCDNVGDVPPEFYEFYNLGLGDPIAVSSVHGHGTGDLLDRVMELVPQEPGRGRRRRRNQGCHYR